VFLALLTLALVLLQAFLQRRDVARHHRRRCNAQALLPVHPRQHELSMQPTSNLPSKVHPQQTLIPGKLQPKLPPTSWIAHSDCTTSKRLRQFITLLIERAYNTKNDPMQPTSGSHLRSPEITLLMGKSNTHPQTPASRPVQNIPS
jgi:hypothetical protein